MSGKSTKIFIVSGFSLIFGIIISLLIFCLMPIGLHNFDTVTVQSVYGKKNIIIPIKLVNGVYSPSRNSFNSSNSLDELCNLYISNTDNGKVVIKNSAALLYNKEEPFTQSQLVKCEKNSCEFDYILTNGGMSFRNEEIIIPMFLAKEPCKVLIENKTNMLLAENVNLQNIIDFYSMLNDYIMISDIKENSFVLKNKSKKSIPIYVTYSIALNLLEYHID